MPRLLLLGPAHDAAGVRNDEVDAKTVDEVLRIAVDRYGSQFEEILAVSQVWVNGEVASRSDVVGASDEVAVLPPISGG